MNSFCLGHLNPSFNRSDLQEIFPALPVWKTCMRSLVCFDAVHLQEVTAKSEQLNLQLHIFKDANAYQYLMEVICGLKSEIVGETQVLGQFKIFLTQLEKQHKTFYLNHYSLFQNLLQDCKELREKHIQNWGGSSYGSLTRKMVELTPHISVLGNGQLAQSLLPWMKEKTLVVYGRNPKNQSEQLLSLEALREVKVKTEERSLVIAAPLENSFLQELLALVPFAQVIDWRTEASLDLAGLPGVNYHSFMHLTAFIENEKIKKQQHIDKLSEIILEKIVLWQDRRQHRPHGWEDLC